VATDELSDPHTTLPVISPVVPSEYWAVAESWTVSFLDSVKMEVETVILVRVAASRAEAETNKKRPTREQ